MDILLWPEKFVAVKVGTLRNVVDDLLARQIVRSVYTLYRRSHGRD